MVAAGEGIGVVRALNLVVLVVAVQGLEAVLEETHLALHQVKAILVEPAARVVAVEVTMAVEAVAVAAQVLGAIISARPRRIQ